MVQEISIDYFIRSVACQGKFCDQVGDEPFYNSIFIGNELFAILSVSSKNFLFTS